MLCRACDAFARLLSGGTAPYPNDTQRACRTRNVFARLLSRTAIRHPPDATEVTPSVEAIR